MAFTGAKKKSGILFILSLLPGIGRFKRLLLTDSPATAGLDTSPHTACPNDEQLLRLGSIHIHPFLRNGSATMTDGGSAAATLWPGHAFAAQFPP
jgi:hypothetical protein